MKAGLTSITFRALSVEAVIALCARSGLAGIEWGGDVHVPPGDTRLAERAAKQTREAGLAVSSYGSYYRLGHDDAQPELDAVLDAAAALGTTDVRVWPGRRHCESADDPYFQRVVAEALDAGAQAAQRGMRIAFEFHGGSQTETNAGARLLMDAVAHPAVGIYWQPALSQSIDYRLEGLQMIADRLVNLHVFQWTDGPRVRWPLAQGEAEWRQYIECARATGWDGWALLEYVKDDDPEQCVADAEVLNRLVECA